MSHPPIKIEQLEAQFLRLEKGGWRSAESIEDAQGVLFLCPECFATNGGPVGTHSVLCWFLGRGVPDSESPGPGRWEPVGTGLHDLTLRNGSSSIHLTGPGCGWHGFVRNGQVVSA